MPPPLLIDLERVNTDQVLYDKAFIYDRMPYRHEFMLLDGVCLAEREEGLAVAFHDCRAEEWWARGHIPGRPIFPGVLQVEASAQLIAFLTRYMDGFDSFLAFGGVEDCRFRDAVIPPERFIMVAKIIEDRPRRIKADVQGIVRGKIVFQARIAGLAMPDAS
jgi:3-hydroxyacyl-[acyl-carrier-protein] dehydratase